MARMVKRWDAYRLLAATVLLLACSNSHGPNAGTSGSNWLKCDTLSDCGEAPAAVACGEDGYCRDASGERIALDAEADASARDSSAALEESCYWDTDALLALTNAGHVVEQRIDCGFYAFGDAGLERGVSCFQEAWFAARAAEITVEECADCGLERTYVSTSDNWLYTIRREADEHDDDVAQIRFWRCQEAVVEPGPQGFVGCKSPADYYRCNQPLGAPMREGPEPAGPVQPHKLRDVPAAGGVSTATLHLFVSNQSVSDPLVGIDVSIDAQRVVTGDFAVEGQHNWLEFAIQVPLGQHRLSAVGPDEVAMNLDLDMVAEYWVVIEYWHEPPADAGFTSLDQDRPVAFQ